MNEQNNDVNSELEAVNFKKADRATKKRNRILKPLSLCLIFLFTLLCSVTLFTLQARGLKIAVTPEPDSLEILGGFFTYQLGERFLILPGDYRIRVKAEGYKDLEMAITVGAEPNQTIELEMAKLPGFLIANSAPTADIDVFIDEVYQGKTPLRTKIEPGLHDIFFQSERYLTYSTKIQIEGRNLEQTVTANLSPAWAELNISSNPSSAEIVVGEEKVGITPTKIELLQGDHTVKLSKAGFKVWQSDITVSAGSVINLDSINLLKADGQLSIVTDPAGANITIDAKYQGQSPLVATLEPEKTHEILLTKAGFEPIQKAIEVEPGQEITLKSNLIPMTGVVELEIEPNDATVLLDGLELKSNTRRLTLSATRHRIQIIKSGYATKDMIIIPKAGLTQELVVQLKTEAEAKVAAIPSKIQVMENVTAKLIIPDKFTMGSKRGERGRRTNEIEKEVQLARPFYLGTKEITNLAFKKFDPSHDSGVLGRSLLSDDDRPVVNISWEQGILFCNWLSKRNNLEVAYEKVGNIWRLKEPISTGFRLPTEAEWAWAARYNQGNSATRFPWGDYMPPPPNAGNYADESAANMSSYYIIGYNDSYRGTAPVGSFPANTFGIQDLNGNVSEWVNDIYATSARRGVFIDPIGPKTGDYYVIRGANYTSGRFSELRWTYRDYGKTGRPEVGFRIARYAE